MLTQIQSNLTGYGPLFPDAVDQMKTCLATSNAVAGALMADHHVGYACPVGGVIARRDHISPSEVGMDVACGNKAVLTDLTYTDVCNRLPSIMDRIYSEISFGVGRNNDTDDVDDDLFYNSAWNEIDVLKPLKEMARRQLGTVGSGNHYVDVFRDGLSRIWVGVHFGSRGLGHKIATHYIKAGGGKDGINVDPAILDVKSDLGREYITAMNLAGLYAYAGRNYVCNHVVKNILGGHIVDEVHNHHNFAWEEKHFGEDLWVVRKGATPAFPGQRGFVGASMGEDAVILKGVDHQNCIPAMYSTVHGAGRVMSRTQAAGKSKWIKGKKTRVSEGAVSEQMMSDWVSSAGVVLRGAGVDESPHCYKRLKDVLAAHEGTIEITERLTPIGVAMAGSDTFDPYKD
jgi:tRNA-splicing ligase RtcB